MKKDCIEIAVNDHRKSLPDAAYDSTQDVFLTVWTSAPGENSLTADYFVSGQFISSTGEKLGDIIDILKTEDIVMLPRLVYNPNKNQYLVIYCLGKAFEAIIESQDVQPKDGEEVVQQKKQGGFQ